MKPAKEYNRKTKKWETVTEQVGDLKKRDHCRGKREHDWCLTLPDHILSHGMNTPPSAKAILMYYKTEKMRRELDDKIDGMLVLLGFKSSWIRKMSGITYYICSVCGKKKFE